MGCLEWSSREGLRTQSEVEREGRKWEEVALILWLGRPNRYWPGGKLLWMEILADELPITQPASGYLI